MCDQERVTIEDWLIPHRARIIEELKESWPGVDFEVLDISIHAVVGGKQSGSMDIPFSYAGSIGPHEDLPRDLKDFLIKSFEQTISELEEE